MLPSLVARYHSWQMFLCQVLQLIQSGNMADNTGLGALCVRDIEDKAKCVQRLTVLEQMEAGVF